MHTAVLNSIFCCLACMLHPHGEELSVVVHKPHGICLPGLREATSHSKCTCSLLLFWEARDMLLAENHTMFSKQLCCDATIQTENTIAAAPDADFVLFSAGAMAQPSPAVAVNELPSTPVSPTPATPSPGLSCSYLTKTANSVFDWIWLCLWVTCITHFRWPSV